MESKAKISYKEVHAYMLQKTQEYYRNPPDVLVDYVIEAYKAQGEDIPREIARERVSLLNIQRYVKQEMAQKWPEFMSRIPDNPLLKTVD